MPSTLGFSKEVLARELKLTDEKLIAMSSRWGSRIARTEAFHPTGLHG